jgi:hypothetical protein
MGKILSNPRKTSAMRKMCGLIISIERTEGEVEGVYLDNNSPPVLSQE